VELEAVHSQAQIRSSSENIAVKGRIRTGKIYINLQHARSGRILALLFI
jgi:hypothetical protein